MQTNLISGALGAEINGINLKDSSEKNCIKINKLLLEHKVLFFRDQDISAEEQISLAKFFGPLERHIYVKGREKYPEIIRIIKGPNEKHQWGETWHTDVSYNVKPTKVIILRSVKIPPVGGDTMFSNMEIAYETLDEAIKNQMEDGTTTVIEVMCTKELGAPFRKDALSTPVRYLKKYSDYT